MLKLKTDRMKELFSWAMKNRLKADARSRYLIRELQKLSPEHPALKANLDLLSGATNAGEDVTFDLQKESESKKVE